MKKYIVLSVNENNDYLYYTPLTCWAWRRLGWHPILFYQGKVNKITTLIEDTFSELHGEMTQEMKDLYKLDLYIVEPIECYRSDTITQISRLYAGCIIDTHEMVMTGDLDMIPLSDYWKPEAEKVTVYGHDLTGYGHYPICYIAMDGYKWAEVMKLKNFDYDQHIKRDLDTLPQAKEITDWEKRWFSDQDLITARLKEYGTGKIDFINRGQYSNGFAKGRVDRGSWSLNHEVLIDAHLEQQTWQNDEKIRRLFELLHHAFPKEDFLWMAQYTKEFKKLSV